VTSRSGQKLASVADASFLVANVDIDLTPATVAVCNDPSEVAEAIKGAVAAGSPIAVRGGGYSPAGLGTIGGGTVIDLSRLNHVAVDPAAHSVTVGGGALTGDVDAALQKLGLATTLPIPSRVGVVGATLSGGVGFFLRKFGFTCDALLGATIVTADGEFVDAAAPEHAELLWALRGGGGNFGAVTEIVLRTHELTHVTVVQRIFDLDVAADALRLYRDWTDGLSNDVTAVVFLRSLPPLPDVPVERIGSPVMAVSVVHCGSPDDAARDLAPLAAHQPKLWGRELQMSVGQLREVANAGFPHARFGVLTRSGWAHELSDAAIEATIEVSATLPRSDTVFEIARLEGAVSQFERSASAAAGRDAAFLINIMGLWTEPDVAAAVRDWVVEADRRTRPLFGSDGVVPSFVAAGELDLAEATYGNDFAPLRSVKRRYDPDNSFGRNLNVRP
jgi:FAD/FMN-containing dehydrogenase